LGRSDLQEAFFRLLKSGKVRWLWARPPAGTWSVARGRPGGPEALRTEGAPRGAPDLPASVAARVQEGNVYVDVILRGIASLRAAGAEVDWGVEHPDRSLVWGLPELRALGNVEGVGEVGFDMCQFGAPYRKRVKVLTSSAKVRALRRLCEGGHKHLALRGRERRDGVYVYRTGLAQEPPCMYDYELGRIIARDVVASNSTSARVAVEELREFPPLPAAVVEAAEWRVLWGAKWRHAETIHRLEGRASIGALRWLTRRTGTFATRCVILCDNLSATHAFNRGRATDRGLLGLCRRAAALQVGGRMRVRWRYIESHRNPADAPSRWV